MANNITPKLKAYVQTDATGRVVSGTPVFRSSKPKDGNWREIPMYYRGTGSSTTTTTTAGGGGVTPTAWVGATSATSQGACAGGGSIYLLYTSTSTLGIGTRLWSDAALTIPFNNGVLTEPWIIINGNVYLLVSQGGNVVIGAQGSCTTTTTTTTQGGISFTVFASQTRQEACQQTNGQYVTVYAATPLGNNVQIFMNAALTIPYDYAYGAVVWAGNSTYEVANGYLSYQTACYANSLLAGRGNTPNEACSGAGGSIYVYYNNSYNLGVGIQLYSDGLLITPYNPNVNGYYVKLYFQAQDQVCTLNSNGAIDSYTAC